MASPCCVESQPLLLEDEGLVEVLEDDSWRNDDGPTLDISNTEALEAKCKEIMVAQGASADLVRMAPALVAFVQGHVTSVPNFSVSNEAHLTRLVGMLVKQNGKVGVEHRLGRGLASYMVDGENTRFPCADELILVHSLSRMRGNSAPVSDIVPSELATLGDRGPSKVDLRLADLAMKAFPIFSILRIDDRVTLLLASSPLDVEDTLSMFFGEGTRLVFKGEGDDARLVGLGSDSEEADFVEFEHSLPVSSWHSGVGRWVLAMLQRVQQALRQEFTSMLVRMRSGWSSNVSVLAKEDFTSGSRNLRRLALRIIFTDIFMKSGKPKSDTLEEAKRWIEVEVAFIAGRIREVLPKRARSQLIFLREVLRDLIRIVLSIQTSAPQNPGRANLLAEYGHWEVQDAGSEVEFKLVVNGVQNTQLYGFCFSPVLSMLVCSDLTSSIRQGVFASFSGDVWAGLTAMIGPAGTGKHESLKDLANELGRQVVVFNAEQIQPYAWNNGSPLAEAIDAFAGEMPGTFFLIDIGGNMPYAEFASEHLQQLVQLRSNDHMQQRFVQRGHARLSTFLGFACHHLQLQAEKLGMKELPESGSFVTTQLAGVSQAAQACMVRLDVPPVTPLAVSTLDREGVKNPELAWKMMLSAYECMQQRQRDARDQSNRSGDEKSQRRLAEQFQLEDKSPSMRWIKALAVHIGSLARGLGPERGSALLQNHSACVALGMAAWDTFMGHRYLIEAQKEAQDRMLLTLAVESGSTHAMEKAVEARKHACLLNKHPGLSYAEKYVTRPFVAMDVTMLLLFHAELAVKVVHGTDEMSITLNGTRLVGVEDFAGQSELLVAALLCDDGVLDRVLVSPAFLALLKTKVASLWPLYLLESCLLLAFLISATGFAFELQHCTQPCVGLATYFAMAELLQIRAKASPPLGLRSKRRLLAHFDAYNCCDTMAVVMVFLIWFGVLTARWSKAVMMMFIFLKAIFHLRNVEAFGFLVSMLVTTVWMMKEFAALLCLVIFAFAILFELLLGDPELDAIEQLNDLGMQVWDTYLLTILGAFEPERFMQNGWLVCFFQLLVFITNIVMLNVLITIVSESYGLAQSMKDEIFRRQMVNMVVSLENTFLRPCAKRTTRRGKDCLLIRYPSWLLSMARLLGADVDAKDGELILRVEETAAADAVDKEAAERHMTERSLLRAIGDQTRNQLAEMKLELNRIMKQSADNFAEIQAGKSKNEMPTAQSPTQGVPT